MTKTFTMQSQDEHAPPQWLVSAFLVLLSVAILGAVPPSSAGNRVTTGATGTTEGLAERIVVRAKIQILFLPSQPAGSADLILTATAPAPVAAANDRIVPRAHDAGTRIAQRGIKIRAPPAILA